MSPNQQSTAGSPWGSGATPGAEARLQEARRWVDRLTIVAVAALLCVGAVMAALATGEGLQRRAPTAKLGIDRALRQRGWAVGPSQVHSQYARKGQRSGEPSLFDKLFPAPVAHGDGQPSMRGAAVVLERVALLERAEPHARAVTTIDAGDVVIISKEMGDWVLVVTKQDNRPVFGWTHRDRVRRLSSHLGSPGDP